ncbi:hypothetical protein COB55_03785 [Candidatus Wolfebacteria bacterium]|nr:MAG: hypothetical protein COB55_03785 [Candidatus Wolfebacteria bacterium]
MSKIIEIGIKISKFTGTDCLSVSPGDDTIHIVIDKFYKWKIHEKRFGWLNLQKYFIEFLYYIIPESRGYKIKFKSRIFSGGENGPFIIEKESFDYIPYRDNNILR